jgi:3-(methylthio)propanoyl-CoA dehydrogenase
MLLTIKSLTQAARGLAYTAAATLDVAHSAPAENQRAAAMRRADLLTPIVKAWCSDVAVEVASLGVQIHGGMGFVDDAEISQVYRDARIGPIFEGTNYIQAQDLLGRKVIRDKAAVLGELLTQIEKAAQTLPGTADTGAAIAPVRAQPSVTASSLTPLRSGLLDSCARLRAATTELIANSAQQPDLIGATAYHFLQWLGLLTGGWQLALAATRAAAEPNTGAGTARTTADMAAFYAAHILPRALAHEATVRNGTAPVATASAADL